MLGQLALTLQHIALWVTVGEVGWPEFFGILQIVVMPTAYYILLLT